MRANIGTEARVNGKNGHITITTEFDVRDLLENHLKGFVDPRWQDTEDAEGATKSLANSLACVPQIAEGIISLMVWRSTEDGDSMGNAVMLELRRRLAVAIGAEGEAFKDIAQQLIESLAEIADKRNTIQARDNTIIDLRRMLDQAETARQAANNQLAAKKQECNARYVEIAKLLSDRSPKGTIKCRNCQQVDDQEKIIHPCDNCGARSWGANE